MKPAIMITGGCGFIGHYVVNYFFMHTEWDILVVDKLNYASMGVDRLKEIGVWGNPRVKFYQCDLSHGISHELDDDYGRYQGLKWIIHMAAESHVDRSIEEPAMVIENNVMSTLHP